MDANTLFLSFEGRIGRKAWWFATAVLFVVQVVEGLVQRALGGGLGLVFAFVVSLAVLYVSLAVSVKRWHDRDKSGWWVLIGLVPVLGWIWLFVENACLPGTFGPNRYGLAPDPVR